MLELLPQDFWEGGLLSAPPPPIWAMLCPHVGLSVYVLTLPHVARLVRRPGGQFLLPPPPHRGCSRRQRGMGLHPPPFPCPVHPHTLPPRPQGQETGDGAVRPPPVLRGATPQVVAQSPLVEMGGLCRLRQPPASHPVEGHTQSPEQGCPPRVSLCLGFHLGGGGDRNHPLPARLKMGRPANAAARQGAGQTAARLVAHEGPQRGAGGG